MELELALAAIGLVEKLYPKIEEAVQKGEITTEQQLALHDRVDALRGRHRWSAPNVGDVQRVNYTPPVTPVVGTMAEPNPPSISK